MELRSLGNSDLLVSAVGLGCWPMAGMTNIHANEADSLAALAACCETKINFIDTAYAYGAGGESDRLIRRALGARRDAFVLATKVGIHWRTDGTRVNDARPERLLLECDESLARLGTDRVDLLYLHGPDPQVPIAESAGALAELCAAGKTRTVGVSNVTLQQLEEFAAVCPPAACQLRYNMLQRDIERSIVPWCIERGVAVVAYWPLMKGLLTGKLPRDYQFAENDPRTKYPVFQGEQWHRNQDVVDVLREIARQCGRTVAQVVVNWTIHRRGITVALCGATRRQHVLDNAAACDWQLTCEQLATIDRALAAHDATESASAN